MESGTVGGLDESHQPLVEEGFETQTAIDIKIQDSVLPFSDETDRG